jgi:ATP-dependent Clp protease ATP-binding subunit ClpA
MACHFFLDMTNYRCEDTSSCMNFQSAVCLHCNRRLCILHTTEHNQLIPSSIQHLFNEIEATVQQINNEYEKSRDSYNNVLTSLNQWRTYQTESIQQIYENHLQTVESQQETLNNLQRELIALINHDARQPLERLRNQQNANKETLDHIRRTIDKAQKHSAQLRWNFSTSPSMNVEHEPKSYSPMPVPMQLPLPKPSMISLKLPFIFKSNYISYLR